MCSLPESKTRASTKARVQALEWGPPSAAPPGARVLPPFHRTVAVLLAAVVLQGCTPLLITDTSTCIGIFWHRETTRTLDKEVSGYAGIGLVLQRWSAFVGWVDAHQMVLDLARSPSGVAVVGDTIVYYGDGPWLPHPLDSIPTSLPEGDPSR